ncbi:MAG: hypothetical protein IKM46_00215 [Clostridia bacterium]|nr:hypothetical protein [Clostridia bacterium]
MNDKKYPERKSHRLKYYDYSRCGAYFITICTYDRQKLFGEDAVVPIKWYKEDDVMQYEETFKSSVGAYLRVRPYAIQMVEKWIHELQNKYDYVNIDYYAIMPDHVHLILFLTDEAGAHIGTPLQENGNAIMENHRMTLDNIIKWFKTMTTNEYIRMVKQNVLPPFHKHVWQRDYRDRVIRNRDELYEIRKYIKNNPAKLMYETELM